MLEAVTEQPARRITATNIARACFKMREDPQAYGTALLPLFSLLAFMAGDFKKSQAYEGKTENSSASALNNNLKHPVSLTLTSKSLLHKKQLTEIFSLSEQAFVSLVVLKYLKSEACKKAFTFQDTNTVEDAKKQLESQDQEDEEDKENGGGENKQNDSNSSQKRWEVPLEAFMPSSAKPYNKNDHRFFTLTLRALMKKHEDTDCNLKFEFPECDLTPTESSQDSSGDDPAPERSNYDLLEMPPVWESL